ncbi:hypothetical protein BKA67DRAFT_77268 [Truncatella angustata]|uniref:Uncharacterized protein n=1 Tax=Truncatella angustata TaxID=152316 RepID=A0A9P9A4I0_9PEZI|nr:uncharacterized protein BKA67DRAFT_77268 [Truncatella angustata]KAH6661173.1 hypothetical protein BKA67DRAFT_77268 [Truncatella angustata]
MVGSKMPNPITPSSSIYTTLSQLVLNIGRVISQMTTGVTSLRAVRRAMAASFLLKYSNCIMLTVSIHPEASKVLSLSQQSGARTLRNPQNLRRVNAVETKETPFEASMTAHTLTPTSTTTMSRGIQLNNALLEQTSSHGTNLMRHSLALLQPRGKNVCKAASSIGSFQRHISQHNLQFRMCHNFKLLCHHDVIIGIILAITAVLIVYGRG